MPPKMKMRRNQADRSGRTFRRDASSNSQRSCKGKRSTAFSTGRGGSSEIFPTSCIKPRALKSPAVNPNFGDRLAVLFQLAANIRLLRPPGAKLEHDALRSCGRHQLDGDVADLARAGPYIGRVWRHIASVA